MTTTHPAARGQARARRLPILLSILLLVPGCAATRIELAPGLGIDMATMNRTATGLYLRDVVDGPGTAAQPGDTVVVHYTGWLADGTMFESSRDTGEPLVTRIGPDAPLIAGWNQGLRGMRVGGRRTLVIPPHLAYGSAGVPGVIPRNATLVFDLELMEVR